MWLWMGNKQIEKITQNLNEKCLHAKSVMLMEWKAKSPVIVKHPSLWKNVIQEDLLHHLPEYIISIWMRYIEMSSKLPSVWIFMHFNEHKKSYSISSQLEDFSSWCNITIPEVIKLIMCQSSQIKQHFIRHERMNEMLTCILFYWFSCISENLSCFLLGEISFKCLKCSLHLGAWIVWIIRNICK